MEFIGVLMSKEPVEKGKSENGNEWQRCIAVFETIEQTPKKVAVTFLNNNVTIIMERKIGTLYRVKLDAVSRNYEGRWYTDLRGWRCDPAYHIEEPQQNEPQAADPGQSNFDQNLDPL